MATVGSLTQPGQEMFRLIRGNRLEWRAEVTSGELARLAPGVPATVRLPSGGEVRGTVRMIAPTVDPQTRNAIVYVDLPAGEASPARAGMFARGEFDLGRASALSLPQSAVVQRDGFAYAFRLEGGNRVARIKIGVGRRAGDRIEVTDGLAADAQVVASGTGFLADGDVVRVVPAAPHEFPSMNVSSWSISNPIPAVLLFVLLSLAGVMGFRAMKIQQFPDIDLPTITVTAALPGASPAQMETDVARKIEDSLATVAGVKHIYTMVQSGMVTVTVEFRLEIPTQEALDGVRDAVSRVRSSLPGELRDPTITKVNLSGAPILTYTVASSRMDDEALSWFVDNTVVKRLLSVRGVGAVARVGGVDREIRVELDPARMLAANATAADISRQLRQTQQEASGGRADIGGVEQSVRTIGTVQSAEELARMDIALSDGRRVRLDQLAAVSDTVGERRSAALLDGAPVVGFEIVRSRGAGEVDVAQGVRAELAKLKAEHPDIAIVEAFNFVDPVAENFEGSISLLIEGALLAVLVVWLFLRDWRATLVSATALPLSILPTFGAMYLMGFTLNIVTLLSLSLVVGILVDDAIVEIENIMRHLRMGKTPYMAAMEAADEIGLAVIATSFTLIAVFLPTAFMSGVPGKFFVQFGWTAAISVFFSLVVARMLTPMMAAYLLRPPRGAHAEPRWLAPYLRWATWCLKHRIATLAAAAAFFFGSFALLPLLPTGFVPPDDFSQTQVYLSLPPGSTFEQTLAAAEQARAIVRRNPYVKLVYTAVGGGAAGSDSFTPRGAAEVRKATLTINMAPRSERRGVTKQVIEGQLREALADASRRAHERRPGRLDAEVRAGAGERGRRGAGRARAAWSSASCARCPASATSPRPPAWCGPSSWSGPTSRAPPTWASPPPRSPTRCASPPPATTTRACPSSTWRSGRCRSSSSSRRPRARTSRCSSA